MTNCQHCGSKLLKNAKFCHSCGEAVVMKMEACQACSTLNPIDAIYCMGCGDSLGINKDTKQHQSKRKSKQKEHSNDSSKKGSNKKNQESKENVEAKNWKDGYVYKPIFNVTLTEENVLEEEIKSYFFQNLRITVKDISDEKKYSEYVQAFYDSGFNFYFSQRRKQLVKDLQRIPYLYPNDIDYQVDLLIDNTFEGLLDRFTAAHTRDLNDWQPPDVTRWELIRKEDLNVEKMVFDYLDIDQSDDKHFMNFITMPLPKLKNARKNFLFAGKAEIPLLISDQTVFGSCKDGYALTNRGIYWKAFFNAPHRFYFDELYDIRREQDWMSINGRYFHVNPKMNYKMIKLLKKLRSVYGSPSMN